MSSEFCANTAKSRSAKSADALSCSQFPSTVSAEVSLLITRALNELSNCMQVGLIFHFPWVLTILKKLCISSWLTLRGEKLSNPSFCKSCHKQLNPCNVDSKFLREGTFLAFFVFWSTNRMLLAIQLAALFQNIEWQLLAVTSMRRAFFVFFCILLSTV